MGILGRKAKREQSDRSITDLSRTQLAAGPAAAIPSSFVRAVPFPDLGETEFVYAESVRAMLPRGADDFAAAETLGGSLMAANGGYGFGGAVRDSLGRPVSPKWLDVSCVAARVALCAGG